MSCEISTLRAYQDAMQQDRGNTLRVYHDVMQQDRGNTLRAYQDAMQQDRGNTLLHDLETGEGLQYKIFCYNEETVS